MNPLAATLTGLSFLVKDLWDDRLRSLLTLFTLGAMVVSYLILAAINTVLDDFGQGVIALGRNLVIFSADIIDPMESDLTTADLQAAAQAIQAEYGPQAVRQVSTVIFRHMHVGEWVVQVAAIPSEDKQTVYQIDMIQGRFPAGPGEVAISQAAQAASDWTLGETLSIYGSNFQIVGVLQLSSSQTASIFMTYETGQALFGLQDRFQIGILQIDPRLDAEAARQVAESTPGLSGRVAVYLEDQLNEQYHDYVQSLSNLISVFHLLALLAITFGAYHASSLTLAERGREIGLLLLAGFSQPVTLALLAGRALLQALLAYLLGGCVAGLILWTMDDQAFVVQRGIPLGFQLTSAALIQGLALTLAFTLLGAWLPTFQALRKPVAEQIRTLA